ncbi:MAG: RlmE family RNA methyltransferase [Nitrososphaeraceae archaeon]
MRLADAKRDQYRKLARIQGYRSRSAYKIIQLNQKYNIFKLGDSVIDLGCAPGGWSQVAKKYVGNEGKVIGVDLNFVKPLDDVVFIQGNIEDSQLSDKIQSLSSQVDVFLSDLSPNVSGIWQVDHLKQISISLIALSLASKLLRKGGKAVFKIFDGESAGQIRDNFITLFDAVIKSKPNASRQKSSENYFICLGFKRTPMN